MRILVTGSGGFLGKNLTAELRNRQCGELLEYHRGTPPALLDEYCRKADFVFHLAGVNRPEDPSLYWEGNFGLTKSLIASLKENRNPCPVMMASSAQAALDNLYGRSKKAAEDLLFLHGRESGAKILIYRFPNLFGKWSAPDYNSVIATFCHNTARDLPVQVHDRDRILNLAYIDDVAEELILALEERPHKAGDYCHVPAVYSRKLGEIADLIASFRESRKNLQIPDLSEEFPRKLYSTYLSFLPQDRFSYPLEMKSDSRGSFTEWIKLGSFGQVSVNIIKPGITKGDHWHHTKCEKFLIASGEGIVRFRKVGSPDVIEYLSAGSRLEAIDIPPGYAHNIENTGSRDLVAVMWANEEFDPARPDTFPLKVRQPVSG